MDVSWVLLYGARKGDVHAAQQVSHQRKAASADIIMEGRDAPLPVLGNALPGVTGLTLHEGERAVIS